MNVTVSGIRRLLALALLSALAATAVALLAGGSPTSAADSEPVEQPGNPWAPRQTPAELEAAFAANFGLLRGPSDDSIPATLPVDDPALQLAESRELAQPSARALARTDGEGDADPEQPDTTVWVTPKDDGSQCLLAYRPADGTLGTGCAFPSQAVVGDFVITVSRTGVDAEVYGLMPDGVDEVTVTLADGSSATLPVIDNGYVARFDQPTASISWTDPDDGARTRSLLSGG